MLDTNVVDPATAHRRWKLSTIVPFALLLIAGISSLVRSARPPVPTTATRMTVLDVGQGDAILIDGPGDAEVLVDGGPMENLAHTLRRLLGNDRTIDLLVLTHPHADHLVGLASVLERYTIGRILMTGIVHTTGEYERFLEIVRDRKIPTTVAVAGQTYDVGLSRLEILYPFEDLSGKRVENLNSSSIVAMLTVSAPSQQPQAAPLRQGFEGQASRTFRTLLTGDAESDVEAQLLERYCPSENQKSEIRNPKPVPCTALAADVLKVPHHGSQDSSSSAFLTAVQPQHAIISVGKKNDYGHPHRRLLKRLERTGARIWRTDQNGDITVTIGPDDLSVSNKR